MMDRKTADAAAQWAKAWLASVADGRNTMSQRKLSSIEQHGGGLAAVRKVAKSMGVHLLLLEDDKGAELIAASAKPFKVIC